MSQHIKHFGSHVVQFEAEIHKNLCGHSFFLADEAEQQMFRSDVVMIQVSSFFDCILDSLLDSWCLWQLAHTDHFRSRLNNLLHLQPNLAQVDAQIFEYIGSNTGAFFDKAKKNMFCADVLM